MTELFREYDKRKCTRTGFLPLPLGERVRMRGEYARAVTSSVRSGAGFSPSPLWGEGWVRGEYAWAVTGSVRRHAGSLCHLFSRERVKGARRRPLNNPGSRRKGSRKEKTPGISVDSRARFGLRRVGKRSATHLLATTPVAGGATAYPPYKEGGVKARGLSPA